MGLNGQTHELMDLNHPNEFKLHTLKNLQTNIQNFLLNPLVFALLLAKYKKDLVFEEFGFNTLFIYLFLFFMFWFVGESNSFKFSIQGESMSG